MASAEKRNDNLGPETPKTDSDDVKDPSSQSLDSDDWPLPSASEVSLGSELFRVKQEVVTADESAESISDCSNYMLSSGGRLQKNEQEYENDCFAGMHLLKSEALPAMEELRLKDGVEHQISAEDAQQLLAEALSDDLNFSGDLVSKCEKSSNGMQHSLYGGNRFEVADNRPLRFPSQPGDSKLIGAAESIQTGSDQPSVAMLSKYGMLGTSGNGFAADRSNLPAASGDGYLSGSSVVGGGGMLRRSFADNKIRRATEQQPLTPSYVVKRGFGSATSNAQCGSSAQCAPVSPFAGRAVYPTSHNPSQSSLNSTMFEFPPTNNLLDGGIMGHSSTPIHSNYGLAQQHTPHTPLSPYTPLPNAPYTPKNSSSSSRLSRFQFSPSLSGHKDSSACESPYQLHQKSTYHPYNPHSSLPSPRYTQMHHQQLQQQQLNNDDFEHDVMKMNKEFERLQQLVEEDKSKNNILQLDQSFHIQQHESGLYRQQEAICETAKRLQCLGSDQLPDTLACNQDQNINPLISFGKYPNQQRPFLDEKIDHERSEFDMDLELETLNMLNLSSTGSMPDKKFTFAETSMGQEISDIDQLGGINMFIMEDQYGEISNEITLSEISDVDVLVGRNEVSLVSGDSLDMNFMASNAAGVVGSKMDNQRVQPSIPSWMNGESLPRYDVVVSSVRKDGMFLNPNQLSGFKRRKCRPDPIIIPPCVNNFQTITNPHYSPNVVSGIRKNSLSASHQPPPYTALPINGPVNGDYGSFQVPFDVWAPQSAPTFHCTEAGLMCKSLFLGDSIFIRVSEVLI